MNKFLLGDKEHIRTGSVSKPTRTYREVDLGLNALIGRTVSAAKVDDHKGLVILNTDKGRLFLSWSGECCAHCYLENFSGIDNLLGGKILEAEHAEWTGVKRNSDEFDVLEAMGTKLKTDKGYVNFETRVSHNGHYGGHISISDKGPIDAYSCFESYDENEMKPLEDF